MLANLNYGELDGQRILNADSYDLLWNPSTALDIQSEFNLFQREHFSQFTPVTHGLSWYLGEIDGHRIVFHAGRDTGFTSFILLIPDEQIGVVIASNWDQTDTPSMAGDLARLILESVDQ